MPTTSPRKVISPKSAQAATTSPRGKKPPTPGPQSKKMKLVGYNNFVRTNPKSDKFEMLRFHHVEFYCQDATNISKRFQFGLGMNCIAKSDQSTQNHACASYVLRSGDLTMVITAPYSIKNQKKEQNSNHGSFNVEFAHEFNKKHGLAVRALGITVGDAKKAYKVSVENGAIGVLEPVVLKDEKTKTELVVSEVKLYGEVVLRYVSGNYKGRYFPGYENVDGPEMSIGIQRLDHAVGNVPNLLEAVEYISKFTVFHEFAEFTAEDVGTVDSGLNSMVLANNNELILLPVNEPTFGTKRKSQIQTYLEQNEGAGLQHMALKTDNIFHTLAEMRKRSHIGGFDFMPRPSKEYYQKLPAKIGNDLTKEQYKKIEELGLLVDKDDQGILLQIFTKPVGDRPTAFFEIIERVGCAEEKNGKVEQAAGCGGFGKGNFSELFKSIEEYEKTLDV